MTSTRPYLRKKAVLIMYKVFLQFPEALRPAFPRLKEKLEDPDTGYMLLLISRAHFVLSILFCPMLKRCCYCQIMTTLLYYQDYCHNVVILYMFKNCMQVHLYH